MPGTNGYNTWSYDVDTSTFKPDEYIIKVSGITNEVTGSAAFNILEAFTLNLHTFGKNTGNYPPDSISSSHHLIPTPHADCCNTIPDLRYLGYYRPYCSVYSTTDGKNLIFPGNF